MKSMLVAVLLSLAIVCHAWCRFPGAASHCGISTRPRHSEWSALEMALSKPFMTTSDFFQLLGGDDNFFAPASVGRPSSSSQYSSNFHLMPLDVVETLGSYEMVIDLPGVDKKDIDISIRGDEITVSAQRVATIETSLPTTESTTENVDSKTDVNGNTVVEENAKQTSKINKPEYVRRERKVGSVSRSFTLPEDADTGSVRAESKDGVLRIVIGKKEEKEPDQKKINIL
mmetsp:Transcript_38039/g.28025  ORF Transcript_38039/g.28025 Transcript_38039/m.28025 type:complete len:229 (-) Transcript_38039:171-857(-)|eukprot:CAMPEP_0202966632 /NCGR_PEP_ID=MMETSP1396-20130829/11163_1 /ASSEMBLY_ACC=CAM_ASM_000872 /TAXON_ID= /ORGANISM="Pseudokeronopsis sp., Strain Brazil" /LENGTH=228 /DNA_ID=CAMNT_0049690759 /DNA_START=107 /DNA_END=793 /DNA_ORIENTATION=-